ncbi:MAG: hypothetical protein ABI346_03760 [Candidatus Baltobacteraceae bacterium]
MRRLTICGSALTLFAFGYASASAAAVDLTPWFTRATAYHAGGTATKLAAADFLGGRSLETMCRIAHWRPGTKHPSFVSGLWALASYDRRHGIALAVSTTDQCSVALFEAPPPALGAPDADLSRYSTGRGLRIGSSYAKVRALYGGPPAGGTRFVRIYSALVPGFTASIPRKRIFLPEIMTLVIGHDRVTSITIYVDESGEF